MLAPVKVLQYLLRFPFKYLQMEIQPLQKQSVLQLKIYIFSNYLLHKHVIATILLVVIITM